MGLLADTHTHTRTHDRAPPKFVYNTGNYRSYYNTGNYRSYKKDQYDRGLTEVSSGLPERDRAVGEEEREREREINV